MLFKKIQLFALSLVFFGSLNCHALVLEDLIQDKKLAETLSNKRIGYYIGSFDPIHLGHEALARETITRNICDYVLIYPAWGGDNYKNRVDIQIRLEMVFALFADDLHIIVTKLNAEELQQALTKESDLLIADKPTVKSKFSGTEYIGIIGSDHALDTADAKKLSVFMQGIKIPEKYKAHSAGAVIALPASYFVVGLRAEDSLDELNGTFSGRPIIAAIASQNVNNISSTKIRKAIREGTSINDLVCPAVQEIISKYRLYEE